MAAGGCVVAVALLSFTCFHSSADAERHFHTKSSRNLHSFVGCNVSSPSTNRIMTLQEHPHGGAEGVVYKAKDQNGRYAAVKLMHDAGSQNKEFTNLQKLSKVRSLHISNLEPDFETVTTCCQEKPCVVTEFIDGQDLVTAFFFDKNGFLMGDDLDDTARLSNFAGKISYQLLRSILFQSLTAFRDTERAGLCNGDQHLGNIMIDKEGRIVFIDFGLATETNSKCPPAGNFGTDGEFGAILQSFPSLSYLLPKNATTDREAYLASCKRLQCKRLRDCKTEEMYRNATHALFGEAFANDPGAFFNLHPDDIITKQRKALIETGSPYIRPGSSLSETGSHYIRPVSNPGPLKDDVARVRPMHHKALSLGL